MLFYAYCECNPQQFLTKKGTNVPWLKWQMSGKDYQLDGDVCPYCAKDITAEKTKISKMQESFDTKEIDSLNKIIDIFIKFKKYFTDETNEKIKEISENITGITPEQNHYLNTIREQADILRTKLENLRNISFITLQENIDDVFNSVTAYKIDLSYISSLNSSFVKGKIEIINKSINSILEKIGEIKGEVKKQKSLIERTISKYDKDIKINDLSKKLALPLKTIQEAFKYWEEAGVLIKKHTGYILVNLQEVELLKLYSPKLTSSPEDIKKNAKNQYRAKAIENINNQFFQGIMSPSWYSDIDMWFKKYNFDEQVMLALFNYCFDHSALHRNYIQVVADSWYKNNIRSFSDLDKYYEKQEKISSVKKSIIKKLGLNRNLTVYEDAYVEKWTIDYGYSLDIIEIALKKTTSKSNISFEYLNKIISDWHDRNLKTATEIQEYIQMSKQKQENIKDMKKQVSNYNNSNQRTYDNFDNLYANN